MTSNRLADEKSPYLLQHAHNPVNWFAWGEAAFARARTTPALANSSAIAEARREFMAVTFPNRAVYLRSAKNSVNS